MKAKLSALGLLALMLLALSSCSIQESDQGISGSVYVTLTDEANLPLTGARISVDGIERSQFTPATVTGLSLGSHRISAFLPGYLEGEATVDVRFNQTSNAELSTAAAPPAAIELTGAPDSTVLLLNNIASGTTPPALFPNIGIGTYRVSMYLAGHATDLPAQWTTTLALSDTFKIPANFTAVASGSDPGNLAPLFALPDDRDSTIYRLQDYRGQVILLTFFYSDCAPCAAEMPYIQRVYQDEQYAGKIQFFGVDPQDSYFTFRQFRIIRHPELGLTFPLLYATQQGVREAYNVIPFPTNIFIDQTGKIRYREAGVNEELLRNRIESLLAEGGG